MNANATMLRIISVPRRAFLVGAALSILNGLMFVIGPSVSNVGYLLLLAFALLKKQNIGVVPVLISLLMISYVLASSVMAFSHHASEFSDVAHRWVVYARGLIIMILIASVASREEEIKDLLHGLAFGFMLVLLLSVPSLVGEMTGINLNFMSWVSPSARSFTAYQGLFHNPNYWAIYCFTGFGFLFLAYKESGFGARLFIASAMIGSVVSILYTQSRMGLLAVVLFISFFKFYQYLSGRTRVLGVVAGLIFICLLAFLAERLFSSGILYQQLIDLGFDRSADRFMRLHQHMSEEGRFQRAVGYLSIFENTGAFFLGRGLGNFGNFGAPHNTYITLLVEFGASGPLLFLMFLFCSLFSIYFKKGIDEGLRVYVLSLASMLVLVVALNDFVDVRSFWVVFSITLMVSILPNRHKGGSYS